MERRIHHLVELPDYVTLAGVAAAIVSMLAAIEHRFALAALLLLAATACDLADGKVARAVGRRNWQFGAALDALSDAVAFGAAPAVFGYCLGLDGPIAVCALVAFAVAALLRLARFLALPYSASEFTGMPVTYNGVFVPVAYFALQAFAAEPAIVPALTALYLGLAALMVSTIRWIKF